MSEMRVNVIHSSVYPCRTSVGTVDAEYMWDKLTETHFLYAAEIVLDLYSMLSEKDKQYILNTPRKDLNKLHFTFGQDIRNTYGLWHPKNPAIKLEHPDDTSYRIIEALYDFLIIKQEK